MQFEFDGQFRTKGEWGKKLIDDILARYAADAMEGAFAQRLRTRWFWEEHGGHEWHIVMVRTQFFERCVGAYRKDQVSGDFIYDIEMDDPAIIEWAFGLNLRKIMGLYAIPEADIVLAQLAWGPQESQAA